jgi:gamma-glutamyltranspeptidase/glutathione hydrolase
MRRVSIASPSQLASDAGAAVADEGGNAVDAAIAASLVAMCTDPGIIAPSSGGFLTIWSREGEPVVIDAYAEMPGRGHERADPSAGIREVWMEYGGGIDTVIGPGSVATPGALAGFGLASERYGAVPWRVVVEPAIAAVASGFPLSSAAAQYLAYSHEIIFGWDDDSFAILHDESGDMLSEGEQVRIPDLVGSLEQIASEGPDALYRGDLGRTIARAVLDGGGVMTERDLAEYEPLIRTPIMTRLDGWLIASNPPPAVGGACMAALLMLYVSEGVDGWTARDVRKMIEAQRAVFGFRKEQFDPALGERLESSAILLEAAGEGDLSRLLGSPSTAHVSAVDSDGTGCAITVSAGYGSGMMVAGTGIWLNNSLGELELNPHGIHADPPGTRLVSNMAPTVVRQDRGSVMAIGSPGADRITTANAAVLHNYITLGMSLRDAVGHPRLHTELFEGAWRAAHEPGLPVAGVDAIEARRFPDLSMYFGGVQAALWDPDAGLFETADPRRAGAVARGGFDHTPHGG